MGTGYQFNLCHPVTNEVIKRVRYIDIFDVSDYTDVDSSTLTDSDMARYYEEFKSNILQYGRERFHEICKPIILQLLNLEKL
jgi:hypothetical protein